MSHGLWGPSLLLALVLLGTGSTVPALGRIDLYAPTGTAGVHDGTGVEGRGPVPATDGVFFLLGLLVAPVLSVLAAVAQIGESSGPIAGLAAASTRGPPRRSARP